MMINKKIRQILFWGIALVSIAIDQLTKTGMRGFMELRGGEDLEIVPGFFYLVHSYNTGVAFGMFQGAPLFLLYIPIVLVTGIMFFVLMRGEWRRFTLLGVSFIFAGAMGNLIDRVRVGRVFDFLSFRAGDLQWPAFNVADMFIVAGVAFFGIAMLKGEIDNIESGKPGVDGKENKRVSDSGPRGAAKGKKKKR